MFDIGFLELLLLAIIAMVVIGPERLPGAARSVGQTIGKVRRFFNSIQNQIEQEIRLEELNKKIMAETKELEIKANNLTNNHQKQAHNTHHLTENPNAESDDSAKEPRT
ncbi:Sec-independent protein translocase protein TatB [Gynuella sunshinyii]|uniref:Sec-independent protein translocase protein TatB n=1 Tax=Gynuella sunshinyii YC6258 TaxID=1445510 RepID=A0A0C5V0N0_9GAMM|nr:Sec-independent protein translocase protein TatB [Gynuella sunshinyii]AJQ93110.1 sec-independent protein secretion pathway component [Gynuella sunshinyii YC6258]